MKYLSPILKWRSILLLCLPISLFAQVSSTPPRVSPASGMAQPGPQPATDTALFRIIRSGDLTALKQKMDAGADASATMNGFSALMIATLSGSVEEMQMLLDHGAKVNYADDDSITALWL